MLEEQQDPTFTSSLLSRSIKAASVQYVAAADTEHKDLERALDHNASDNKWDTQDTNGSINVIQYCTLGGASSKACCYITQCVAMTRSPGAHEAQREKIRRRGVEQEVISTCVCHIW